mmetsp:Transcript_3687/g.10129  ORF Transcript_3687/g.10129 Transcript_3687/m.10129 type:complete len:282 (+) Transcript_3687:559-1404(+)
MAPLAAALVELWSSKPMPVSLHPGAMTVSSASFTRQPRRYRCSLKAALRRAAMAIHFATRTHFSTTCSLSNLALGEGGVDSADDAFFDALPWRCRELSRSCKLMTPLWSSSRDRKAVWTSHPHKVSTSSPRRSIQPANSIKLSSPLPSKFSILYTLSSLPSLNARASRSAPKPCLGAPSSSVSRYWKRSTSACRRKACPEPFGALCNLDKASPCLCAHISPTGQKVSSATSMLCRLCWCCASSCSDRYQCTKTSVSIELPPKVLNGIPTRLPPLSMLSHDS